MLTQQTLPLSASYQWEQVSCRCSRWKSALPETRVSWNTLKNDGSAPWKQQSMRQVAFKGYSVVKRADMKRFWFRYWVSKEQVAVSSLQGLHWTVPLNSQAALWALLENYEGGSLLAIVAAAHLFSFKKGIKTSSWLRVIKATQSSLNSEEKKSFRSLKHCVR